MNNKVTKCVQDVSGSRFILMKHLCRSWFCPHCKLNKGLRVRIALHGKLDLFREPRLLTFTVDPSRFASPADAYNRVRQGKFIPIAMRYLGVKTWFCVLEFQGNGFPHWHLLIDVSDLPSVWFAKTPDGRLQFNARPDDYPDAYEVKNFLDLKRLHSLWRHWGIGEQVDLSRKKTKTAVRDPKHAVNYITKYLLKYPVGGYPSWVWETSGIRVISTSKSIGSLGLSKSGGESDSDSGDVHNERGKPSANINRVGACRIQTKVLVESPTGYNEFARLDFPLEYIQSHFQSVLYEHEMTLKDGSIYKVSAISPSGLVDLIEFSVHGEDFFLDNFFKNCDRLGYDPFSEVDKLGSTG